MYELLNRYIPTHVMGLPQKPENQNALEYYIKELESLKDVLGKLTGSKIADIRLRNEIKSTNETRKLLRALYELRKRDSPPIRGTEMLKVLRQMHFLSTDGFRKNLILLLYELEPDVDLLEKVVTVDYLNLSSFKEWFEVGNK